MKQQVSRPMGYSGVHKNSLKESTVVLQEGPCFKKIGEAQPKVERRAVNPVSKLSFGIHGLFRRLNPEGYKYNPYLKPKRFLTQPAQGVANNGRDNAQKDLIVYMGEHIVDVNTNTEYWIRSLLGCGTFGQVLRARNNKTGDTVAVKIIKNEHSYYNQSQIEVKMLKKIENRFGDGKADGVHAVRLLSQFDYAGHLCLVFELLSVNLFELIESNGYKGLSLTTIHPIITQVLTTLKACADLGIVHCDLKPENILIVNPPHTDIKLIDFGSACEEDHTVYTYIQSRYYRAPEVLLGVQYNTMIDMWSLGCVAAELFLGLPLLPGYNDYNQLYRMVEMLGSPPKHLIEAGTKSCLYFKRCVDGESDSDEEEPPAPPPVPGKRVPLPPPKIYPSHGYKIKNEREFYAGSSEKRQPFKRYFYYHKLSDIVARYSWPKVINDCKNAVEKARLIEEEKKKRVVFTDFLHGLVYTDPLERWPAAVALKHPFITGEKFDGLGHFHNECALPEIAKMREKKKAESTKPIPMSVSPGLPYAGWGEAASSTPIDCKGMLSPGYFGSTPTSSFAQSPIPVGTEGMPLGISPMPAHLIPNTSFGGSFAAASLHGTSAPHHMGTPTLTSHMGGASMAGGGSMPGATPIPIPMNQEPYHSNSIPTSCPSNSWMGGDSFGGTPVMGNHPSPPVGAANPLGTSPSQPSSVGAHRQQQRKGYRGKQKQETPPQRSAPLSVPSHGTSPGGYGSSPGYPPPSYGQQPMGHQRTQSHGTPTSSYFPQNMLGQVPQQQIFQQQQQHQQTHVPHAGTQPVQYQQYQAVRNDSHDWVGNDWD